ncbi:hypothetical protein SAMN04488058_12214 [Deinococcus reticulitermitis]|uniref:Tetratricopeptide repeat-containing protein n=1 Tax=Deinococcus reticulitermitis TaxID=856736 RepID=A0A1H7C2T9_9DEIO|nr:hypothetical protein [Deinococcus reticulitermitis]SEJ83958.1 hypothetical protein SAMN04488058_12214 [Deinococcus reticulitermitis]
MLHLEDLHEAGPDAQGRAAALAGVVKRARGVGLLVTSRTPPPQDFEALRLLPLDRAHSDALLEAEAASALPGEGLAWLFAHAAGNPLFTLEYFRLLARQGFLWNDGQRWHWRPPPGDPMPVMVEALIERILLEVSAEPHLAGVIGARALLPVGVGGPLLAALTGLRPEALAEAEHELERRGILAGGDFIHPLYRETALRTLPPERRRRLARLALVALADDLLAASRFVEAAELDPAAELDWLLRAAAGRGAAGDRVGAARLLALSLHHGDGDAAARRALEAAHGLKEVDVPEATRLAERAAQAPGSRSAAIWLLSELLAAQGQGRLAEGRLTQLPPAEREGLAFVARVLRLRAQDNGRLLELLDEHPGVLAQADPGTVCQVGRSLAYCGRADEAEAVARDLLARTGGDPDARVMGLKVMSVVAQVRGDFAAMERLELEVLNLVRPTGNLRLLDAALFNRAMALGTLGRSREQAACLEEALGVCQTLGDPTALANEQAAQERQDAQDDADARAYINLYPEFGAVLQPPADAINADGDRLVSVPTAAGPKTVTLLGQAFGKAVLATHARTFPSQVNQYSLYSTLYTDLDITLKKLNNTVQQFGLPAPDEVKNYSAERLIVLNKKASDVIREYGAEIYDLSFFLDPANLETGAKDQLDRTQKGPAGRPPPGASTRTSTGR